MTEKRKYYSTFDDKFEWIETFEMLEKDEEVVQSSLSFGKFVSIKKELFDKIIQEVNDSRLLNGTAGEEIELIIISGDEDGISSED